LRPDDPLQRYRDDAQRQEEAFAEARRKAEEEECQRRETAASREAGLLRSAFEVRITALEQDNAELWANLVEGARSTVGAIERVAEQRVELSREQREELRDLKIEVAKLGSILTELREAKGFQFAREKGPIDLPDFLPRRLVN
jgi:hypothetical protein